MTKKQVAGIAAAAILFVVSGYTKKVVQDNLQENIGDFWNIEDKIYSLNDEIKDYPEQDFVGVINISGTIQDTGSSDLFTTVEYDHQGILDFVDDMMNNNSNTGLFLNIDSPGGYTYEIVELYDKLMEYKKTTKRPIYAYCNSYCCSGGYYLAATADEIYANQESVVGSIGCIMTNYDCSELYSKLGIKEINITSGKNKAMGSTGTPMTDEQKAIYQSIVDEAYENFVEAVSKGRNMDKEDVYAVSDGRIYTSSQAEEAGLVDGISTFDKFNEYMSDKFDDAQYYTFGQDQQNIYSMLLGKIENMLPKSDTQANLELLNEYKNGGLMYYADLK